MAGERPTIRYATSHEAIVRATGPSLTPFFSPSSDDGKRSPPVPGGGSPTNRKFAGTQKDFNSKKRLKNALKLGAAKDVDVTDVKMQLKLAKRIFKYFDGTNGLRRKDFYKILGNLMTPDPDTFPDSPLLPQVYSDVLLGGSNSRKIVVKKPYHRIESYMLKIIKWIKDPKVPKFEYIEFEEFIEVLTQRVYNKLSSGSPVKVDVLAALVTIMECGQYVGSVYTSHKYKIRSSNGTVAEEEFFDYIFRLTYIRAMSRQQYSKYELAKMLRVLAQLLILPNFFESYGWTSSREAQRSRTREMLTIDKAMAARLIQATWRRAMFKAKLRRHAAARLIQKWVRGWLTRRHLFLEFPRVFNQKRQQARKSAFMERATSKFAKAALKEVEAMGSRARIRKIKEDCKLWHETRTKRTRKNQRHQWNPFAHWYIRQLFRIISPYGKEEIRVSTMRRFLKSSPMNHILKPFLARNLADKVGSESNSRKKVTCAEFVGFLKRLLHTAFNKLDVDGGGLSIDEVTLFITLLRGEMSDSEESRKTIQMVHEMLDQDGNGEVDEMEFTGFMLYSWTSEQSSGSTHNMKLFMSLVAVVCCEPSISFNMGMAIKTAPKMSFADVVVDAQKKFKGGSSADTLSNARRKRAPGGHRREGKARPKKRTFFPKKRFPHLENRAPFPERLSQQPRSKTSPMSKKQERKWNDSIYDSSKKNRRLHPTLKKCFDKYTPLRLPALASKSPQTGKDPAEDPIEVNMDEFPELTDPLSPAEEMQVKLERKLLEHRIAVHERKTKRIKNVYSFVKKKRFRRKGTPEYMKPNKRREFHVPAMRERRIKAQRDRIKQGKRWQT